MHRIKYKLYFLLYMIVVPGILKLVYNLLPRRKNTLLLVKNDGIGDYILFRNYFECLKKSEKYKDYDIYLLGNTAYEDLSRKLDQDTIAGFYAYSDGYFLKWKMMQLLINLQRLRPQTIIYACYSRKSQVDKLLNWVVAGNKIAIDGDTLNETPEQKIEGDQYYTQLIDLGNAPIHEFERNRQLIEKLTGEPCTIQKPYIDKAQLNITQTESVVVFPGGSEAAKRWPVEKFNTLCGLLIQKQNKHIALSGGKADIADATKVKEGLSEDHITDTTGNLSLLDVCGLIAGAEMLITNDTVSVHIAVAVDTPVVCVAKGDIYERFIPYPASISKNVFAIFPPAAAAGAVNYYQWSPLNINDIEVDAVYKAAEAVLAPKSTNAN